MRYKVSPTVHRNLAASKRSIVIMCAAIALVLGTTSVGASSFFVSNDPVPATSSASLINSNYENITTGEQPLPPVANKPLGIQQPLNFGPKPHTQTGRIGVEIGPVSVAAIITQIKRIAQPPEIAVPIIIAPAAPAVSATPTTPPSISTPPVISSPPAVTEPTPTDPDPVTDPPIQEPPAPEDERPPSDPSLGIQNTEYTPTGSSSTALAQ